MCIFVCVARKSRVIVSFYMRVWFDRIKYRDWYADTNADLSIDHFGAECMSYTECLPCGILS